MIKPTNAQSISRVLRLAGFNPHSAGDSNSRWVALLCSKSGLGEVRVRCWSNVEDKEPSDDDRGVIREIARLLTSKGYKIRYDAGAYYLYVQGKETKTMETKTEAPGTMKIDPEDPRKHVEVRLYTRSIVPGTLPDQQLQYRNTIVFRPDELRFKVSRVHAAGKTLPWTIDRVALSGWRVLKGGRVSQTDGQYKTDTYDMVSGPYRHPAPQDVIDYVTAVLDSLNAGE